jgi:lipopolysaccharide transport system permease protein
VSQPETVRIEPGGNARRYARDLIDGLPLVLHLTLRDLVIRYKQTLVGFSWALVQPVLSMIVFTLIFGRVARLPSEGDAPYALMVFAGLLQWQLFSRTVQRSSASIVANRALVTRIYFPRAILVLKEVCVASADAIVSLGILAALMVGYSFAPDYRVLFLPLFLLMAGVTALGLGLLLAAVNVRYRDIAFVVPYVLQLGQFVSPVGYSSKAVPADWAAVYALNPLVAVLDGARWSLLGGRGNLDPTTLATGAVSSLLLLAVGAWTFRRAEAGFADVI